MFRLNQDGTVTQVGHKTALTGDEVASLLFEPIVFGPGVTLRSVLQMVERSPVLRAVYKKCGIEELLAEALAPTLPYALRECALPNYVSYLELYHQVRMSNAPEAPAAEMEGHDEMEFHGVRHHLGDTIYYSLGLSSCRHFLDIQLKVNRIARVFEGSPQNPNWMQPLPSLEMPIPFLGVVLKGILSELSYQGAPLEEELEEEI